jgi:hypothetical protein
MRGLAELESKAWRRAARTDNQSASSTSPPGTTTAKLHITQVSTLLRFTNGAAVQVLNQSPGHAARVVRHTLSGCFVRRPERARKTAMTFVSLRPRHCATHAQA